MLRPRWSALTLVILSACGQDDPARQTPSPAADGGADVLDPPDAAADSLAPDAAPDAAQDAPTEATDTGTHEKVTVRPDGFYHGETRFLPLIAWELPQGVTEAEALGAGFDVLAGPGNEGLRAIAVLASGADIAPFVEPYLSMPNLVGWVGPDEALWNGTPVQTLESEFVAPLRAADPDRAILLNHAPRGSQAEPLAFDLLTPYLALSDVALMDIYPVPEGNGHSALPAHPGLTAMGAHTDILRGLIEGSGREQPLLMIVLGAGLGRIPPERWEMLETWVEEDALPATGVRGLAVCDVDADDEAEAVLVFSSPTPSLAVYDFGHSAFGERAFTVPLPGDLDAQGVRRVVCGDFRGDGRDDVLMLVDGGSARQDVWVADSTAGGIAPPTLRHRYLEQDFTLSVVRHAATADVDGDECSDLVFSYDYPNGTQRLFGVRSGCAGIVESTLASATVLAEGTVAELDLEEWLHMGAADLDGDGGDDVVFGRGDGVQSDLVWLRSEGSTVASPAALVTVPASEMDLSGGRMALGDLTANGVPEVIVLRGAKMAVGVTDASLSGFSVSPWFGPGGVDESDVIAMAAGDVDGDGREDVVVAEPSGSGFRLRLAASTGAYFGARDPVAEEMRFMAYDALSHGSAGLVFWCQQFASKSDAVWGRLAGVATELGAILPHLAGETVARGTVQGRGFWWVKDGTGWVLVEQNDQRGGQAAGVDRALPMGATGSTMLWSASARAFQADPSVVISGGSLIHAVPMRGYETRIYRVAP